MTILKQWPFSEFRKKYLWVHIDLSYVFTKQLFFHGSFWYSDVHVDFTDLWYFRLNDILEDADNLIVVKEAPDHYYLRLKDEFE